MRKKFSIGLIVVCIANSSYPFDQIIPEPKAKVHCSYDGNWYSPEEYSLYCKPPQSENINQRIKTPSSLSTFQQMQINMMQGILQSFFNSFFSSIFSPPKNLQQENSLKQQEENKKATEAWQKHLEEAERQAKQEIERKKKAGQEILSQVRVGSQPLGSYTIIGPRTSESQTSLSTTDWGNPRGNSVLSSSVTSEKAKEQLLRAAYFSKMAETALLNGDLEAARFWAGVAFEGDFSSPRIIDYKPPKELLDSIDTKKVKELNQKLLNYSFFFREALSTFDKLQYIILKIDELSVKKKEKENKLKEIEEQRKTVQFQIEDTKSPEEKSRANDLLTKAVHLKQQVEAELQDIYKEEQKLIQEKQTLEKSISDIKNKLQHDMRGVYEQK